MIANFAVRFKTKYATLGEAWRQFARGEVPESFPPEWRGGNYYASVFSNETEPAVKAAAQNFLSELDAAKFDGRTYIARLTLATQAFARAVCHSAGLKWEPAARPSQGTAAGWPMLAPKHSVASGPAASPPKLPAVPAVAEAAKPEPVSEPAPQAAPTVSAKKPAAARPPSKAAGGPSQTREAGGAQNGGKETAGQIQRARAQGSQAANGCQARRSASAAQDL